MGVNPSAPLLLKPSLPREPDSDPALNHQLLQAIGLEHVRRLSRRIWTDHNLHDPGITTLELLCYALTDLSYRARFPIEDVLATEQNNAANMGGQFYTAGQILPNRALTESDYRKLVIDLPGVKNAWLLAVPLTLYADTVKARLLADDPGTPAVREVTVRGRYEVLIEYMDEITTQAQRESVNKRTLDLLAANRNLCQDFIAARGVPTQDYALCAELELETDADVSTVVAQVQFAVQRYLAPPVRNYSLSEMLARQHADGAPCTAPEIFDGPRLLHGFIDDAELAASALREEVRLSDIVSVIMDIAGVRAIRDIVVNALDAAGNPLPTSDKWRMAVPTGTQPRLSISNSRLVCYKRHMPLPVDTLAVDVARQSLETAERAKLDGLPQEDIPIPLGRYRRVQSYRSFQHHFPQVYGISERGLPVASGPLRHAQALQFKAYLLFFDQLMADYFAQLGKVRELFSREPDVADTYFAQVVHSVPDHAKLYKSDANTDAKLSALFESTEAALARRDKFVDHLLARFAEEFHHYVSVMRSAFGASVAGTIASKCAVLADMPKLGAERSLAYNYRLADEASLWNSLNVSGLERRLARLLGIVNFARRNLGDVSYDMYAEVDATPGDEFRFRVRHPVSGKILLSSSTNYLSKSAARVEMIRAIDFAQQAIGYQRKQTVDGKHYFNVIDNTGEVIARRIEYFSTEGAMEEAIEQLITHLTEHYSGEGMYLIENLLLLPEQADDSFLPICVDPDCSDCADDDPYSYRIHVVLPAYAGRFANMDFRRFVEETIRQETPAHILPKICWVDADDMAMFEAAYRDWISLRAGATTADRKEKLSNFIAALFKVKNIYPEQKLFACASEESKPSFILGRSALGSMDT